MRDGDGKTRREDVMIKGKMNTIRRDEKLRIQWLQKEAFKLMNIIKCRNEEKYGIAL